MFLLDVTAIPVATTTTPAFPLEKAVAIAALAILAVLLFIVLKRK